MITKSITIKKFNIGKGDTAKTYDNARNILQNRKL